MRIIVVRSSGAALFLLTFLLPILGFGAPGAARETGWSTRAGVEVARIPSPGHPPRIIRVMGEFYDGPAPSGQFYREDIRHWGFGVHLSR